MCVANYFIFSSLHLVYQSYCPFFTESESEINGNMIWINYSLPLIIYGVLCPFISTIISSVLRLFVESQIHNIKNKNNYIYKKREKPDFVPSYVISQLMLFIVDMF